MMSMFNCSIMVGERIQDGIRGYRKREVTTDRIPLGEREAVTDERREGLILKNTNIKKYPQRLLTSTHRAPRTPQPAHLIH